MDSSRTSRLVPVASALSPNARDRVLEAIGAWRGEAGALLPILHAVQNALGFIPAAAVLLIAHELNLSRAEVHGVVSFYHYFRTTPPGNHVIYLCRAEACQALGARALEAHAKKSLGVEFHGTTTDGAITLEPVYCLGNCGCGPSVLVDADGLHARVTSESFDALIATARAT